MATPAIPEISTSLTDVTSEQPDRTLTSKAFVRWCRSHSLGDLSHNEVERWGKLLGHVNSILK